MACLPSERPTHEGARGPGNARAFLLPLTSSQLIRGGRSAKPREREAWRIGQAEVAGVRESPDSVQFSAAGVSCFGAASTESDFSFFGEASPESDVSFSAFLPLVA